MCEFIMAVSGKGTRYVQVIPAQQKSPRTMKGRLETPDCFGLFLDVKLKQSGERGIRTPGALSDTQHFQCCTIGHSAISPSGINKCLKRALPGIYAPACSATRSSRSMESFTRKHDTSCATSCPITDGTLPNFAAWTMIAQSASEKEDRNQQCAAPVEPSRAIGSRTLFRATSLQHRRLLQRHWPYRPCAVPLQLHAFPGLRLHTDDVEAGDAPRLTYAKPDSCRETCP